MSIEVCLLTISQVFLITVKTVLQVFDKQTEARLMKHLLPMNLFALNLTQ